MREGGPSALGDRQIYRQAVMETCLFKPPAKAFAGVYVGSYSCSVQPVIISCPAVTRPRDDTKPTKTRRPADGDGTLISFMLCYVMQRNPTWEASSRSLHAQRVLCIV